MMIKPALAAIMATGLIVPGAPKLVLPKPEVVKAQNLDFSKHMLAMPLTMGLLARPASGALPSVAFQSTFNDETDATSYTVTGAALGSAATGRAIVVAIMGRVPSGNPVAPSTVTVGGVSATLVVSQQTAGDRNSASLWIASVPTGATGDIVVSFGSTTQQRCGIGWWAAYDLTSLTPTATNSSDVSGASLSINVSAGGLAFGTGNAGTGATTTFTWTGLTENYDAAVGTGNGWHTGASVVSAGGATPLSITCTGSGTPANDMYVVASFR